MDDLDLDALKLDPSDPNLTRTAKPRGHKARSFFVKVPLTWLEKLNGASGQTCRLALYLLYFHWRGRGAPITLANRTLECGGIPSQSKRRALRYLEARGLVSVAWRAKRSPVVRILHPD